MNQLHNANGMLVFLVSFLFSMAWKSQWHLLPLFFLPALPTNGTKKHSSLSSDCSSTCNWLSWLVTMRTANSITQNAITAFLRSAVTLMDFLLNEIVLLFIAICLFAKNTDDCWITEDQQNVFHQKNLFWSVDLSNSVMQFVITELPRTICLTKLLCHNAMQGQCKFLVHWGHTEKTLFGVLT